MPPRGGRGRWPGRGWNELAPFSQRRPDRKGVDDARIAQDQDKDRATPEPGETDVLALPPAALCPADLVPCISRLSAICLPYRSEILLHVRRRRPPRTFPAAGCLPTAPTGPPREPCPRPRRYVAARVDRPQ